MSFTPFGRPPIATLVDDAGSSARLTVLVGAGASMEAGLPSWEGLLRRLLLRAARETALIDADDEAERERWLAEAARDGPLGAAAMVDALAGSARDAWLREELYAPAAGPEPFFPGPISSQIPVLRAAFGDALRVMTLNYDDLIEQAVRAEGVAEPVALATARHRIAAGQMPVFHLHGYLGRDGAPAGDLILSEADYLRMQRGTAWQEATVRAALMDSTFVFVGTSLLDPNVLRYLHGVPADAGASRYAIFVRQGTYGNDVPEGIPPARERALAARWGALGVTAVFVDHYTDVAQLLSEIARRRTEGAAYAPLPERAAAWVDVVERAILGRESDEAFVRGQQGVNRLLNAALRRAVAEAEQLGGASWGETLALSLWLVDATGERMTHWVTTDRMHLDRRTVEPVRISEHSRWLAVRSYCRGTPLAESREVYASRWRFIRGTPLVLDGPRHGRMPVGCLTTASLAPKEETQLARMPDAVASAFNRVLGDTVLTLLEMPFEAAPG